ncbi:MAG: bifunctional ornithine acetyltransferase/N-acetylglutamate synthase, partial [Candidatus Latescibacteria bacterium]|nr:bifunctional ornithine acetyltransferase/N-acetylglutamate synthase [Candidatus Latescibacterota bacterium]
MKILDGGNVCSAKGFQASGLNCGVKAGDRDLALVYSETEASGAAVYTKNKVQAAPIQVCREHLADGRAQAVVLNSGNANACTGDEGLANARRMCEVTAGRIGVDTGDVLVCSTGVIGVQLPIGLIEEGIPRGAEALSGNGGNDAAEAIMTTDTVPKT